MRSQQLPDVGLERDEVRRVLRVAPDRDGAGHVAVQQAERPAEQVDARRDDRRPHVMIVERQRLEQVVGVALVIGRVDHLPGRRRRDRALDVLDVPVDLPQDRIERVLERPVERVALRRPQLLEVGVHPLPGVGGVVHTHSTYAVGWAARGEEIPCVITGMADEFGGPIPIGPFAVIGDDSIGRGIVETLRGHRSRAALMQNHGPFTIGVTAKDAVKAAVMCEDAARTVHIARQGGPLIPIPQDKIDSLYARYQSVYGQSSDVRR